MESEMSFSYLSEADFVVEAESSLTDRYQTTVPETVRRALKLGKRDKIHYGVTSNGEVVMFRAPATAEEDPAFGPFLVFLARDIQNRPEKLRSFSPAFVQRVQALTEDVQIDLDAALSPDDE
jgi:antitoxin PrlF